MRLKNANRYLYIVLIPVLSIIASCELDVPISEMSIAKMTITRAVEVKAEKYAPDELKKAREFLFNCHQDIKNGDTKKAKENADKSLDYANRAVNKSLPLLSKDTLEEAKKMQEEADRLYSEKYATEEFNKSGKNLKEAEALHVEKEYWDSYLKSKEAVRYASDARGKSLTHLPELKEKVEKIKNEADFLKASGEDFTSEDQDKVNLNLNGATEDINKQNLKAANMKINEAIDILTKTQKGIAAEKIKEAESLFKTADQSKLRDIYKKDMEKASSLIPESKKLYENNSFKDSISKSVEAIAILKSVTTKAVELKKTAADKIESAENALKKIEESDKKGNFKEDISKVSPLIAKSRELYDRESYQESITISDEAHEIINSINIAIEKMEEEARLSKKEGVVGEYVVKLNLKKRDCLWRIAFYVYKNARLWPLIYSANKDKIKDPDLIFPGQKFIIPTIPKKGQKKEEIKKDDSAVIEEKEKKDTSE